jgi:D-alanine--poly(phosphoribitol) ligase subunit 1
MNELSPLGKLSPNFNFEILPIDEGNSNVGELCLYGPCVGLGYYNDIERSNTSFVQNPIKKYREIMYKTGDLVELGTDGNLYFKGRVDNQIKHMGYRIELEEIEAALSSLSYINECVVVYHRINTELGFIRAIVSVNEDTNKEKINEDLKLKIPPYMIPKEVSFLSELPKNQNGKIDRNQIKLNYA